MVKLKLTLRNFQYQFIRRVPDAQLCLLAPAQLTAWKLFSEEVLTETR
jgi:hypothetical protein